MTLDQNKRPPDPFGDDEDIFDINCRPATKADLGQVAFLALGLLNKLFGDMIGAIDTNAQEIVESSLRNRLRLDSTWVMTEGKTVIGAIDLETVETRKLNGLAIPRVLAERLGLTEKIAEAGLLPLLVHEPEPDECHQPIVALLSGSRGEGRGTLLLMHGAFWAKAQGKHWTTTWLPEDDPGYQVYKRRGYFVEKELESSSPTPGQKWLFLKRPISSQAHKILRTKGNSGTGTNSVI